MTISIVVPAYNEAQRILPSLERAFTYMEREHPEFEIVLVDDGSTDGMAALVRQRFADRAQLRVLSYGGNRGKGYAVRYGTLQARGDVVLFSDADFSTPIEELEKLLVRLAEGYDLAIGSRAVSGSEIRQRQPFYREGAGKFFNLLVRLFVLPDFHDTQCGFKCFRREPLLPVVRQLQIDGFAFDVELIALAVAAGLRVTEVPVVWVNSPSSRVRFRHGLAAFADLHGIRRRARVLAAQRRVGEEAPTTGPLG